MEINYQAIGSGGGVRQVQDGLLDFGASDGPMSDAQLRSAKVPVLHVPTVLGAVVPVYNVPNLKHDLNFSPQVIAGIYLGTISRWNDARVMSDNPGVDLPDHEILPVYRSDGSGTTFVFTDFLTKTSPEWARQIGRSTSVRWPIGIGQKGSEGVSGMVEQSPYAFGYVEMNYAAQNGMTYGRIGNAAGEWVKASPESIMAAADAAAGAIPADFRVSITNGPGHGVYPVSSFTWLLVPVVPKDAAHGPVVKEFLRWMLTKGEDQAAGMNYAPLPPALRARVLNSLSGLR